MTFVITYITLQIERTVKLIGRWHNILVLKDLVETKTMKSGRNSNIIIDLNGYSVTGDITNLKTGKLVMTDSSDNKAGQFLGTITNNGIFIVEDGNYNNMPISNQGAITTLMGMIGLFCTLKRQLF